LDPESPPVSPLIVSQPVVIATTPNIATARLNAFMRSSPCRRRPASARSGCFRRGIL